MATNSSGVVVPPKSTSPQQQIPTSPTTQQPQNAQQQQPQPQQQKPTSTEVHSVGPFILGRTLGEGATGKVKLGFHKDTGFKAAIKIIKKEMLLARPSLHKKVQREIAILKLIDNPFVLKLYDVYETSKYLFIIMEYVEGGELFEYLVSKGSLDMHEALRLFQMLIHGLDYIHSQHVCHRDLKPENLLLDNDKRLKIADLGMSAIMLKGKLLSTSCGSPHYASPEVVMGKEYDGEMADIWSSGVILYALVSGKLPFDDENIRILLRKVKEGVFTMPPFLHRDVRDLISKMLVVDPTKRITIQGIKHHPFFLSNHNPLVMSVCTTLDDTCEPVIGEFDIDIINTLEALGIGSRSEIEEQLCSPNLSQARMYYRILLYQKDHPPSEVYERVVKVQGRTRASTFAYDEQQKLQLSLGQQNQNQPPTQQQQQTLPPSTSQLRPALPLTPQPAIQPHVVSGRERSCSVGIKTPVITLPHVYVDVTGNSNGPSPRSPSRASTPSIPSPLRGVILPKVSENQTQQQQQQQQPSIVIQASSEHQIIDITSNQGGSHSGRTSPVDESASSGGGSGGSSTQTPALSPGRHSRRKGSMSGRALSANSSQGSPPIGRKSRANSDAAEEIANANQIQPQMSHSPAKRTFWASFFNRGLKANPPPQSQTTQQQQQQQITVSAPATPNNGGGMFNGAEIERRGGTDLAIHSTKPLADIQKELQKSFDSFGIDWRQSDNGFKAKYGTMEGSVTCHFSVILSRVKKMDATTHFIEFRIDKGDHELYNDMCSVLEKTLQKCL